MNLSDAMKTQATGLGLCQQWQSEWKDGTTKDEMVHKFVRGLDFCIKNDFPSVETMKEYFGDVIHRHGVYADDKGLVVSGQHPAILNGDCDMTIEYGEWDVAQVWVRHASKAKIKVKDFAIVRVMVLDGARVEIINESVRPVRVYRYGGIVETKGAVSVKNGENPYK